MPIVEASLRASRARTAGRGVAAAPSSSASSGAAKMSNVSDADTGYPGAPSTGVDVDRAEHDRVAGADGDAVDGELAEPIDQRGGVVVAAGARAGDHDQQVAPLDRVADRAGDPRLVVGLDRQHDDLAAGLAGLAGEHQRVGLEQLAGLELRADRPHLIAGRQDRHDRLAVHADLGGAGGRGRRGVDRAQPVAGGQQQLGGADVLADRARVLVGRDRGPQLGAAVDVVDVLAHHDRVEPVGHRVAGVDAPRTLPGRAAAALSRSRRRSRRRGPRSRPSPRSRTAARIAWPRSARR